MSVCLRQVDSFPLRCGAKEWRRLKVALSHRQTPSSELCSASHHKILSIVLGFWQARALAVATELGCRATNALALFRLLRALESIGIFVEASPGVFSQYGNERHPAQRCTRFTVAYGRALSGQRQRSSAATTARVPRNTSNMAQSGASPGGAIFCSRARAAWVRRFRQA